MISLKDVYHVVEATVPLYAAMFLAYISIKWWKLLSPDQCSGINKFVAKIALPLLSFQVISANNPYQMNPKLIFSDVGQKLLSLFVFSILSKVCFRGNFEWIITGFSVSTMPNTLVVGIPLLKAMYGDEAAQLLGQIIVLQSLVWNTFLLFLFELRAAKMIDLTPSEDTGKNISVALDAEAEAEIVEETGFKLEHRKVQDPAPTKIRTQIILLIVGRKLMRNPNTFSCLAGLIWGLISFRWGLKLPVIVNNSISILSDGGLGMAMFSLGLYMASQPNIIACGIRMLVLSLGIRFIIGPSFMAIPSYSIGMRGTLFSVAIMQAALPQGIVPFIYAKEYGVHADILSTGVIVGMIIVIPISLAYYFLLHPT